MNSTVDAVVVSVIGIATLVSGCRAGCHARYRLPHPLMPHDLLDTWAEMAGAGWHVLVDVDSTPPANGSHVHEFARRGVRATYDECEAR